MIEYYQLKRTWGIPNLCHFCCKTETYMRMAGIDYEYKPAMPIGAPKGKVPYITDDGRVVADSRFIIAHLKSKYGDSLDADLSAEQKAVSLALQRLIEEHLYWVTMYTRWQYTDENWQTNKMAILGDLPPGIRDVMGFVVRRSIRKQIHGHGTGRHSTDEIFELGYKDLDALSDYLGDKPYFLGVNPTSIDATAYGFLMNTLGCPIESPVKEYALKKPNLLAYCQRMTEQYYPEFVGKGAVT